MKQESYSTDLAFVVEEAIRRLPNGEARFAAAKYPLGHACLGMFHGPDFMEELNSNYGMPAANKEIEHEFLEEIATLQKIMEEADVPADWQAGAKSEAAQRVNKGLNRRAHALQVWDWYAIPWRYKNGVIYLIWSPRDVFGSPIIHSYLVNDFLRGLAGKQEALFNQAAQNSKRLALWKNIGIISLTVLGILLFLLIQTR
jgi:hypothetical protein